MHRILQGLLLFFLSISLYGQDIHWTQFDMAPIQLNPARSGDFYGTARLSGIARTQSNSIANTGFFTYAFGLDAPIIKGFRDKDWVGIGLSFATDKAGELELGLKSQLFAGSYHFSLDKKGTSYLTLGVQIESYGRKLGNSDAADFRNNNGMPLPSGNQNDFTNATGYGVGLQWSSNLNERTKMRIGGKFSRIGRMRLPLGQSSNYRIPNRITIHADVDIQTGARTRVMPALLYENYGTASAIVFQAKGKYLLDKKKELDLTGGLGYRFGDALEVLVGLGWGNFDFGIGYDLPVSGQASEAIPLGGLEMAIIYTLKIYKEPKVDPVIFCPRF